MLHCKYSVMWSNCTSNRERERIATNVEKKSCKMSVEDPSSRSHSLALALVVALHVFSFVRRQMNLLLKLESWLKTLQIDKKEESRRKKSENWKVFPPILSLSCRPQHGLNRENLHEHQILTTRLVHTNLSITYFTLVFPGCHRYAWWRCVKSFENQFR